MIDEPDFNGRDPVDALKRRAKGIDLLATSRSTICPAP